MDLLAVFVSATTVAAALAAVVALHRTLSQETRLQRSVNTLVEQHRREYRLLADEADEILERARHERARLHGRRGGRPPKGDQEPEGPEPNGTGKWTADTYRAYVERTGRAIPEVERSLGL